jgi:uncharacterized protein DUF664
VVERAYQILTFEERRPTAQEQAAWEPALTLGAEGRRLLRGQPLEYYLHELSEVRRRTLEGLAGRDDAWLERTLSAAPAMNAHWAWFHVAEDEINHRGQMRWLRAASARRLRVLPAPNGIAVPRRITCSQTGANPGPPRRRLQPSAGSAIMSRRG